MLTGIAQGRVQQMEERGYAVSLGQDDDGMFWCTAHFRAEDKPDGAMCTGISLDSAEDAVRECQMKLRMSVLASFATGLSR